MVQWIAADRIVTIDEIGRGSRSTVVRCGCAVTPTDGDRGRAAPLLTRAAADLIAAKRLTRRQVTAEELELDPGEERYHIAFAVRVGAFDGREPRVGALALERVGRALVPGGRLFVDGGHPLRELEVPTQR